MEEKKFTKAQEDLIMSLIDEEVSKVEDICNTSFTGKSEKYLFLLIRAIVMKRAMKALIKEIAEDKGQDYVDKMSELLDCILTEEVTRKE